MKLIYIAGAYTAQTDLEIEANIIATECYAQPLIASERCAVLIPHSIGRNFKHGPGSPQYWYDATLEMCRRCDALLIVPGSENSRGTIGEIALMRDLERPVFHSALECLEWVEASK